MPSEPIAKITGLVVVIALFLTFSYLFNQANEPNVSIILMFAGIFFAIILASVATRKR